MLLLLFAVVVWLCCGGRIITEHVTGSMCLLWGGLLLQGLPGVLFICFCWGTCFAVCFLFLRGAFNLPHVFLCIKWCCCSFVLLVVVFAVCFLFNMVRLILYVLYRCLFALLLFMFLFTFIFL